jgi:hypothetical protein
VNSIRRTAVFAMIFSRGGFAFTLAALGTLAGGCSTYTAADRADLFAQSAPHPVAVAAGHQLSAAEHVAALNEGDFVLAGSGESMAPFYTSGTAVVVHPTSYFMLRPGMPVVYVNRSGTQVAHMLVEKSDRGWVALGLNNREPDDDLVTEKNLVGVIRYAFVGDPRVGSPMASLNETSPVLIAENLLH